MWLLAIFGGVGQASAQCGVGQVSITTSGITLPAYNPFAAEVISPAVVSIRNLSGRTCDLALSFPSVDPNQATMSGPGGASLNYVIENNNNRKIILYSGAVPSSATDRININNLGSGQTRNVTVDVTTLPGQVVASGLYQDTGMQAHVFNRNGSTLTLIRTASFPVSQTVSKICRLDPPAINLLDLSAAISNGRPLPAVIQATSFTGVQCTAPAYLQLDGAAMTPALPIAARPGFDNYIGWEANGSFGSATAQLLAPTTTPVSVTSASTNVGLGATTNGLVAVSVNLLDSGRHVLKGAYSGTLRVAVMPAP
jgi:hypothetical protein